MKTNVFLVLLSLTLCVAPARADKYHFSGGGGFSIEFGNPKLDFLDDQIQRFTPGFKKIDGPLTFWGGFGYGEVDDNFRLGGYGFGGLFTASGTIPGATGPSIRQDVNISLAGGGVLGEYVLWHPIDRIELDADLGIGFGGTDITIDQFGPNVTWDDMMGSLAPGSSATRQTFSLSFSRAFFMLEPGVAMKFYVNGFLAVEGRASYLWVVGMGDWMFRDVKVLNMPDADMSAPVFGLRFVFGG
jgi:hypothetical protein